MSLFFHLATPKVEHYMAHELSLVGPPGVSSAHVYAHVVSEQGTRLRNIALLFCEFWGQLMAARFSEMILCRMMNSDESQVASPDYIVPHR